MTSGKFIQTIAYTRRRCTPGDSSFVVFGFAMLIAGISLAILPIDRISSPSLQVIYSVLSPRIWSIFFIVFSILPFIAVLHPTIFTRKLVYWIYLPIGCAWTAGLAIPLLSRDTGAFWGPLVWATMTALGYVAFWLIPLDAPFYRSIRHDTLGHRIYTLFKMPGYRGEGRSSSRVPSHLKGK